jgi:hypothetical protein
VTAKPFLASTPWPVIEELNSALCQTGGYQVGRTSDGYEPARELWESTSRLPLTLIEAAKLCRKCHTLGPFLFLNGNTFVSCARIALSPAWKDVSEDQSKIMRAALGHYIAGTITERELVELVAVVAQ